MYKRVCALDDCNNPFETDNARKKHCCKAHSNLAQVRRWRARHRKNGGGNGGPNGGGGGNLTLFDTLTPRDGAFVDLSVIGPNQSDPRKPSEPVRTSKSRAARAA
jgi:hypothetical protein